MKRSIVLTVVLGTILFSACKKKSEDFQTPPISDYAPMEVGKYIIYTLDSTIFINFGAKDTTISYQVKHQVDSLVTDNLGRPTYVIHRYIRKTAAHSWQPDNTFYAVNTGTSLEFVENNMRFLKLKQPLKNGFSWKGNTFIDTYSLNSEVKYLDDWDYTYDSLNTSITLGSLSIDSICKVDQRDEIIGDPNAPDSYSEKNYSSETYAKGIGLVYRNFFHQEYQPPISGSPGYKLGYGVVLTMIEHN